MSIELSERTIAFWFLSLNETSDYIAHLESVEDKDYNYLVTYRFRYYNPRKPDNDPWSMQDRKSWYTVKIQDSDKDNVLQKIRAIIGALELETGNRADEILYKGDISAFLDELSSYSWANARKGKKESFKGEFN